MTGILCTLINATFVCVCFNSFYYTKNVWQIVFLTDHFETRFITQFLSQSGTILNFQIEVEAGES
jgi:hypothetical protein